MTYVICEPCIDVKDRACLDVCPVDCIYEGARTLYIHPDECIDCKACEPVCPVEAIFAEDELPNEWRQYLVINAEFFEPVVAASHATGPAGSAAQQDDARSDHPAVAALPPRPIHD